MVRPCSKRSSVGSTPGSWRSPACSSTGRSRPRRSCRRPSPGRWPGWDRLEQRDDPLPYVRRTVVNLARDGLRRRRTVRRSPAPVVGLAPSADVAVVLDENQRELAAALRSLPERQRECVVLRYLLDLSTAETASTLDITTGSVKTHLSSRPDRARSCPGGNAMTADDLPPTTSDDGDDEHPALVGDLRVLLAAHVDESIATDEAWAEIVRAARDQRSARTRRRTAVIAVLAAAALFVAFVVVRLEASRDEGAQVTTEPEVVPDPTEGTDPGQLGAPAGAGTCPIDRRRCVRQRLRPRTRTPAMPPSTCLHPCHPTEAWNAHSLATFGHPDILAYAVGPGASPDELRAELGISHEQFDQVVVVQPRSGAQPLRRHRSLRPGGHRRSGRDGSAVEPDAGGAGVPGDDLLPLGRSI